MTIGYMKKSVENLERILGANLMKSRTGALILIDKAVKIKELYNKWARIWDSYSFPDITDFESGELEAFIADARKLDLAILEFNNMLAVEEFD